MMNAKTNAAIFGVLLTLLLSGCAGEDATVAPTTSSEPPPAPKVVVDGLTVNACPGLSSNLPVQTTAVRQQFVVEDGYDMLVVSYGESGQGQVNSRIRYTDNNEIVWGGTQRTINEGTCGAHGDHGAGEQIMVEAGVYEAIIEYTGIVDIELSITARSSKSNMTDDHMGH